ncbi:hypothetical protein EGW08_016409 [Elysia chlorotica]|uniref:Endonuclease/exonuclease/phosphatase domain-containing protein n=1 Tax=Elysia chlorotica TaxID=188477 RepID=A0A433T2N7_ELYCH|nr:hypothetical protein EGW08_016409 [Elysia chlorotica]
MMQYVKKCDARSYAGGSLSPGRATYAGQVKGEGPNEERSTGPPGWGLGAGPTTLSRKTTYVTETATKNTYTPWCDGLPELSEDACMNGSGESREEATGRKMEVLNTKTKTRIGFWNVRTMYETGKLAQVTAEMRRYNLHVLGVSESRWTGTGRLKTSTGETVLYSGRDDDLHREGVAVILKKGTEKSLMEWKPINSRLLKVRLRGKHINTTIIQCYAPTNDSDEDIKDEFYDQLQAEIESLPQHELRIIMGNLNAKVGNDNTNYERAMGREGCGSINDNGERLLETCTTYDYVIGGTLFQNQDIHKLTWCSPNERDINQIDHLMINGTWRSLLDVKAMRGSDHHLVMATLRLKLRRSGPRPSGQRRFGVDKLKDNKTRSSFILQVRNRFQTLSNLEQQQEP